MDEELNIENLYNHAKQSIYKKDNFNANSYYNSMSSIDSEDYRTIYVKALLTGIDSTVENMKLEEASKLFDDSVNKASSIMEPILKRSAAVDLNWFSIRLYNQIVHDFESNVSLSNFELFIQRSKEIIKLLEKSLTYDPENLPILENMLTVYNNYNRQYYDKIRRQRIFLLLQTKRETYLKIEEVKKKISTLKYKTTGNIYLSNNDSVKIDTAKTQIIKRPISILLVSLLAALFILILIPFFINPSGEAFFLPVFGVSTIFTIILFVLVFSNSQPRKKWFKIFTSVAFCISIISFILAMAFTPVTSATEKITTKETVISAETTSKETEVAIATEKTNKEETTNQFSFDEYITANVREYNLVKEQDISLKALGDKLPSEYTPAEIDKLPINFRMKYCVVVPRDITEEELTSTLAYIIKTKSDQDLRIDEIYIAAWYDLESVEKEICLARAEWCPEGRWEQMPPIIAENDIRDSYLIKFYFNSSIEQPQVKYGLTEQQRKQAFYELVQLQDQVSQDDPAYDQKMDDAEATIAEKYGITVEQVRAIGVEGITKGWPMPPISSSVSNETIDNKINVESPLKFTYETELPKIWGSKIRVVDPPLITFSDVNVQKGFFLLSDNEILITGNIIGSPNIKYSFNPSQGIFVQLS